MTSQDSRTILLVDDDRDLLPLLARSLRDVGFLTKTSASAEEALSILVSATSGKIDAVISDIWIPDGTGLQLLASVREFKLDIPFFLITGINNIGSQEAKKLGANGLFEKPFYPSTIIEALNDVLRIKKVA